jgi:AMMECR1 domain-containing protein
MMHDFDEAYLYSLAKSSIEHGLTHGAPLMLNPRLQSPIYSAPAQVGVSLFNGQTNLGCQINIFNKKPLHKAVTESAYNAGFKDPRFLPVNKNVLSKASVELVFLLDDKRIKSKLSISEIAKQIEPDDTVYLISGSLNAFMFPTMHARYFSLEEYLKAIKAKAKISESFPWENITVILIKTKVLEAKLYSEIK